ncbi:MAG: GntR family transcriptional regulator [Gaiellales bacterium]
MADRVAVESMVEQTRGILRERIRSGELPPGTRLRQERLAEELGISRTPLREALRLLAADGLVELQVNRGAVVSSLSHADRVAFWEARLALEPGAARLAAERRDPAGVRAMEVAIAAQRAAGDDGAGFAANRAFHLALVGSAGNPHLTRFAEALWVRTVGQAIYRTQASDPAVVAAYADEHAAIAGAIAAGDATLAEALTREHILASPVPDEPR